MTPRERVLTALNPQVPDRVPIDLTGTTVTSITYPAYHRLRDVLGLKPDPGVRLSHLHQGTVHSAEDLLRHYEVDFRTVTMPKSPRAFVVRHLDDDSFEDEYGIVWKRSTYDYSPMVAPLAAATVEDLARASWPDPRDPARVRGLAKDAKRLFETTEYAVVADIMCRGPFELAVKLRGMEQFLTDLVLDERIAVWWDATTGHLRYRDFFSGTSADVPEATGVTYYDVDNGRIVWVNGSAPVRRVYSYRPGVAGATVQPIFNVPDATSVESLQVHGDRVILMSPQGTVLTDQVVRRLAASPGLVVICGRYEGVDERVREHLVTDEISIGDYVLTGGEIAAMVIVDSVSRLVPGVLGRQESHEEESFSDGLLEYPHYTKPAVFRDWAVPDILMSGHHEKIRLWRRKESIRRTLERRPDLVEGREWSKEDRKLLKEIEEEDSGTPSS